MLNKKLIAIVGLVALLGGLLFWATRSRGHTEEVNGLAFSPDGKHLLTSSHDGTIRLWDKYGQEVRRFVGKWGGIYRVRFTPDGQHIISGGGDGFRVWDANTGQDMGSVGVQTFKSDFALSDDGKLKADSDSNDVSIWDVETRKLVRSEKMSRYVSSFEFLPDSETVIVCDDSGTVSLVNARGGSVKRFSLKSNRVQAIAPLKSSSLVLLGDMDGYVHLWDVVKGTEIKSYKLHKNVNGVHLLPGEKEIVSNNYEDFKVWSLTDGKVLREYQADGLFAAISPDGTQVLSVDECSMIAQARLFDSTRYVRLWNLSNGETVLKLKYQCPFRIIFG